MEKHEHDYEFNSYCSAHVCTVFDPKTDEGCGHHKGLARCWCGWSVTSPGRGFQELEELGENMEGLP
ncbi:MAG: hypothetical protein ACXABY_02465 [Candidatus Thorarchaeota archaeon]